MFRTIIVDPKFYKNYAVAVLVVSLMLLAPMLGPVQAQPAPKFRAGAATSNITPPLGGPIVGGFVPFPATHVHDELHARCLVLDDGSTKLVFVVCDLLGLAQVVSDEARAKIHKELGIPPAQVLICATHTHSACSALGQDSRIITHTMTEYQRFVATRIVDGVRRAVNLLRPAQIGWGQALVPEHVFNRRWHMKPGTIPPNPFGGSDQVKMNPPSGPNLVKPAGPTDPAIPFLALREPDGKPIGLFSSYSLHYVGGVGSGHISADYFAMYCEALARLLKTEGQAPAFVAMMSNGTSGDINNINFLKPRGRKQPYEQMKYVADDVAQKVHDALQKVSYRDHVTLAARFREPPIGTRRPTPELVDWAKKTIANPPKVDAGRANLPLAYAQRTMRLADHPETLKIPLQAFRIGDVVLGTMPCEIFCEIGLEFKKRSPLQPAWLVSLGHGYYGYLPSPRQHELGGYETWLGTNRLEVQASVKMLAALLEMVEEMHK